MSERPLDDNRYYVAPAQAPVSRRPPASEIGFYGWLRHNLFANLTDSISTIITLVILGMFLWEVAVWAVLEAQWEVAFLNLKSLGMGTDYPSGGTWRVNLAAYLVLFVSLYAVGLWGKITRGAVIVLAVIGAAMLIIPVFSAAVPEPTIRYYLDSETSINYVNFIGKAGDEITFTINPMTDPDDFVISQLQGYIAKDNQQADTSWDKVNAASAAINTGQFDPTAYDLNLAVRVLDRDREVLAQSDFTGGTTDDFVFTWVTPDDGWYTFTAVFSPEQSGSQGVAWLEVDNVEVYFSTYNETLKREKKFGAEPMEADCDNCLTQTNRTDLRFQGQRTFGQYFSLQLAPYLVFVRQFFFISVAAGAAGYVLGSIARRRIPARADRSFWVLVVLALIISFVLVRGFGENSIVPYVPTARMGGVLLTLVLSSISIVAAFPLGVLLALGRQSKLPAVSMLSTVIIEVVRGVPLITLLFMGRLIVPYFASYLSEVDLFIRMTIVLTFFLAAYLAEVVRGGLQIIPKGQYEAADALGLTGFQSTYLIVLPQALRAVIPAIMGQFVSLFKDTSLVALVGMFEITGALRRILSDTQTGYSLFPREGYLYIGAVYFIFSYIMAEASRKLEESGAGSVRRTQL